MKDGVPCQFRWLYVSSPAFGAPVKLFITKKDFKSMSALVCVVDLLKLNSSTDE